MSQPQRFELEIFEGPLDLLLHLIKRNEVDIQHIPIATITDQYLAYLEFLEQLNLDLAGEYLVMAATLMHLKSRSLLPPEEGADEDDGPTPEEDLIRQLEEFQRFRAAAADLGGRDLLDRDVFRRPPEKLDGEEGLPPLRELTLADLVDALREVVKRLPEDEVAHELVSKRVAIADRIAVIVERLRDGDLEFARLFGEVVERREIIPTFLALLELVRMRVVRALQAERFGPILLTLAVAVDAEVSLDVKDDYK